MSVLRGCAAIAASAADVEAVTAARDYVRVSVAAATAQAYAQVCAANYNLTVNRKVVALQRQTLDATRRLAKGGRGTAFDVSRAQAAVETSEAALPAFEAQRQNGLYLLATLLGRPPADYPRAAETCAAPPTLPLRSGSAPRRAPARPTPRPAHGVQPRDTRRRRGAMPDRCQPRQRHPLGHRSRWAH